jgi:putative NIF3 family GTP cyclohydrolase 1 type 2
VTGWPLTRRGLLAHAPMVLLASPAVAAAAGTQPKGQPQHLTAREVFARIRAASGQPWDPNPTDDRIIYGDRGVPVTGIATCFTASLDVLRRAKAAGLNYIVPHEASFYERYDDFAESALADDDPVLSAKQRFIDANGMVIQRMHSHAHSRPGDAIMTGLVDQLGWATLPQQGNPPRITLAPMTARELGLHLKQRCGRRTLRMAGDPARRVASVSLSAGMPGENMQIAQLESGADAVVLGEVREPEVLGYLQDMGPRAPVTFLLGHTAEDFGMNRVASWLGDIFPQLPARWLAAQDPYFHVG